MQRSILTCVAMLLSTETASAGDAWQSTGPYGGHILEIRSRADAPDLVFAFTNGGLFRSVDRGEHWSRAETGIRGTVGAQSIGYASGVVALDPLDPTTAYVFDTDGVFYRSVDAGASWSPTGFDLADGDVLPTVTIDADTPQHLYLGTNRGIWVSVDHGATFTALSDGQSPVSASGIAIDASDSGHLTVAGLYSPTPPDAGFYYSIDGGANWVAATGSPCLAHVCSLMRDLSPLTGGGAVAAGSGHVFLSPDGVSWGWLFGAFSDPVTSVSTNGAEAILVGGGFGLEFSSDLFNTIAPANDGLSLDGETPLHVQSTRLFPGYPAPGPWFAGTYIGGVFRSDDDGASWHATVTGLAAAPIKSVAVNPNDSSHAFAGASLRSSFEGARALFASSLGGELWTPVAAPPPACTIGSIVFDPTTAGATTTVYATGLFAGERGVVRANSGLYKSTNGGVDWTTLEGGLPLVGQPPVAIAGAIRQLAIDPRSCTAPPAQGVCTSGPLQALYATSSGIYVDDAVRWRVLKSIDAGANWTSSDTGLPYMIYTDHEETMLPSPIVVDPANGAIVYVGTSIFVDAPPGTVPSISSGVYRSDDGGASWVWRSEGLPRYPGSATTALDVLDLAIHPTETSTLWAALWNSFDRNSGLVAKTTDGGAHWSASSSGLALAVVSALLVDPTDPETLYAGGSPTPGSRISIFRSDDGGGHWHPMTNSPPTLVTSLAIDPHDRTHLLAGTSAGVWMSSDAIFANGFDPLALP